MSYYSMWVMKPFPGKTKDAQELFEFHGAEHMTIAAFENNRDLNLDHIKTFPKEHIRCGTAFIFLIVFVSIQLKTL